MILQCLLSTDGILIPEQFAFRLKEWTEVGFPELGNKACCGVGFTVGSVIGHPKFLTDPHKAAFDIWESNGCQLAANGAVMRTAVLGIPFFFNESQVVLNTIKCAKVTHADPRCIFSAVVVSALISRLFSRALAIDDKYRIDDGEREKLLKIMESKTTACENNEGSILSLTNESQPSIADLCIPKSRPADKPNSLFQSLWKKIETLGQKSDNKFPSWWPTHKEPDPKRLETQRSSQGTLIDSLQIRVVTMTLQWNLSKMSCQIICFCSTSTITQQGNVGIMTCRNTVFRTGYMI